MLNPILVSLSSIYCFGRRSRPGGCVRNLFPAKSSFLFSSILFWIFDFQISSLTSSHFLFVDFLFILFFFLLPFFFIFIFLEFTFYFYFLALSLSTSRSIFIFIFSSFNPLTSIYLEGKSTLLIASDFLIRFPVQPSYHLGLLLGKASKQVGEYQLSRYPKAIANTPNILSY